MTLFKRFHSHDETMALALVVWLCSLPLMALIVAPLFGLKVAAGAALGLLVVALLACRGICQWSKH